MTLPIPVDRVQMTDALDELIKRKDGLDLVLGFIPSAFGSSEKATYLGFRAVALPHGAALDILQIQPATFDRWCEDPLFAELCNERLHELQVRCSAEITKMEFMRNMSLFFLLDYRMLRMAHTDFNGMSDNQAAYLRTARRHYTAKTMHDLDVALEPEKHRSQTIVLQFGAAQPMYQVIEGEAGEVQVTGGQQMLSEALPDTASKDQRV